MKRGRFLSLALKDDRVEQCLRSCGSEFQMWGPKQNKHESHDSCVCIAGFSACGCQKKSAVYETGWRHVAVQKGKQDQNLLTPSLLAPRPNRIDASVIIIRLTVSLYDCNYSTLHPPSLPEKRTNTIIPSLRSEARVKASADWTGFTEVRSECNHKGNFDETIYEYLITG